MDAYGKFAKVYDSLMEDVPYDEIANIISDEIKAKKIQNNIVFDLACGTGTLTSLLLKKGYEMIGADASVEMLDVAKAKNPDTLFLNQSMDEFELYGTVGAICCSLDSINYLTEDGELEKTFDLCNNYLEPNGLLIFDINTEYKFKNILSDNIFTYDSENLFYAWENEYIKEEKLCNFYLTFFIQENGHFFRFDEVHTERVYTDREITKTLKKCGFTVLKRYDGFTKNKAHKKSERILYVCENTDSIQLKNMKLRG